MHNCNPADDFMVVSVRDLFEMITKLILPKKKCCPGCGSEKVWKNGYNSKHNRQYRCLNSDCKRYSFVDE
jgi:transposase-like protein